MPEWLRGHWEPLLLVTVLSLTGFLVFRRALAVYGRIFFPARAMRNSLIKSLVMVTTAFLIFAIPHWLFQALLPDGWIQSLSLLISFVLIDIVWDEVDRLVDRLLVG